MINFMFFVRCVLFIYLLLSIINFLLNQPNVHSLDMRLIKKVFCVVILKFVVFMSLEMFSLTNNISFNIILNLLIQLLLYLSLAFQTMTHLLSLSLILCITGGAMRRPQEITLPLLHPPRSPVLHRSTRVTKPPDRYGFSHTSLMATLSTTSIP